MHGLFVMLVGISAAAVIGDRDKQPASVVPKLEEPVVVVSHLGEVIAAVVREAQTIAVPIGDVKQRHPLPVGPTGRAFESHDTAARDTEFEDLRWAWDTFQL